MRRGGTIWWETPQEYVEVLKRDGPVIIIALPESGQPEYPNLARILRTATFAELEATTYREAHEKSKEVKVEGWWGAIATALLDIAQKWSER